MLLFARYFVVFRGQLSVFGGISGLLHLVTDALLWRCNCEATRGQLKATPKVIRGKLCIWQICGLPKLIYNPPPLSLVTCVTLRFSLTHSNCTLLTSARRVQEVHKCIQYLLLLGFETKNTSLIIFKPDMTDVDSLK